MTLTLQIVLAITGSIALLIGLFGGGVKAKEIEVPKIPMWPRILSSLVGMVLIGIAIRLPDPLQQAGMPTSTPIPATEPAPPLMLSKPIATTDTSITTPTDTPTHTPTDTPIPSPTLSPSPTTGPIPEIIPFGSPSDPSSLNAAFGWQAGNSPRNAYDLVSQPNALTLITDGNTDQWADLDTQPVIFYPVGGNFKTQVKIVFSPTWGHEFAALGVRSAQDHLTWLRLVTGGIPEQLIGLDIDKQGNPGKIRTSPYPDNTVYFKIERQGSVFDFSYSHDGINWITLQKGYVAEMPPNVEIFLTVGCWGDGGASAEFYEFKVLNK